VGNVQRWNQNIEPDPMTGDYDIKPSNRKVGDEPRRSGGYACGKCGTKPKFLCQDSMAATAAMSDLAPLVASPAMVTARPVPVAPAPVAPIQSEAETETSAPNVDSASSQVAQAPTQVTAPAPAPAATVIAAKLPVMPCGLNDDHPSDLGMPLPKPMTSATVDPTSSSTSTENTEQQEMSITHGAALIEQLGLKRRKVKGDGSCWIYAILEVAGLLDYGHARSEQTPSPLGRAKDLCCRMLAVTWLQANGEVVLQLNDDEMATVSSFLNTPEYPLEVGADCGTFGNNVSIAGLVPHVKRTIILWDKTTLRNPVARQQVIEYSDTSTVRERVWDLDQIHAYCAANQVIHIEWNGSNPYAALVQSDGPVAIAADLTTMLTNLTPITRLKIKSSANLETAKSTGGWIDIKNGFRLDGAVRETDYTAATPVDILKVDCIYKKCNAIHIIPEQDTVKFVAFDFAIVSKPRTASSPPTSSAACWSSTNRARSASVPRRT
jgi:hypothetical protein